MKDKKSKVNLALLFIVVAIVMYFALRKDFAGVIKQLANINFLYLLIAIAFLIISWLFRSVIFYRLTKRFKSDYKFSNSFVLRVLTQLFDAITPFATGGQPFQVYNLKQKGVSLSNGTNVVVEDFIIFQIGYIIISVFCLLYNQIFRVYITNDILNILIISGFIINLLVFSFVLLLAFSTKISQNIIKIGLKILNKIHIVKDEEKQREKWLESIKLFNKNFKLLFKNKKELIELSIISIISILFLYSVPYFIVIGAGYNNLSFIDSFVASTSTMISASFVPIPGGTGGMEYSFSEIFNNFVDGSSLVAILLTWRFVTYYFGMILGSLVLLFRKNKYKEKV